MNEEQIQFAADEIMTDTGCTELEALSAMQSAAAKMGSEETVEAIARVKETKFLDPVL